MSETTLYTRLGGYDAIAAVADNLVSRLMADEHLGRFWAHRGTDGVVREKQLLIGFLCQSAGGPPSLRPDVYENGAPGYARQRSRLVQVHRTRQCNARSFQAS